MLSGDNSLVSSDKVGMDYRTGMADLCMEARGSAFRASVTLFILVSASSLNSNYLGSLQTTAIITILITINISNTGFIRLT